MADTTHKSYATIATALSTGLNSLANNTASAASSSIDNTTALELYADFELVLGTQTARTSGASVQVWFAVSLDGTNFADVSISSAEYAGSFSLPLTTAAVRAVIRDVAIPPGLFQVFIYNASTQALNASGNTLKYRTHSIKTV
jgi:hypothetical protein